MSRFSVNDATGLNQELHRHKLKEQELLMKIANTTSPVAITAYKNLLALLKQSKANIVQKLGKAKQ